jgi:hypothetical protein
LSSSEPWRPKNGSCNSTVTRDAIRANDTVLAIADAEYRRAPRGIGNLPEFGSNQLGLIHRETEYDTRKCREIAHDDPNLRAIVDACQTLLEFVRASGT